MKTMFTADSQAVEEQLERILRSKSFSGAQRSQHFLRYVTVNSLRDEEPIKEYTIALEVFERDASYDPAVDATVRVEAGRLRSRLRDYYAEEGKGDPLEIEMPKGGYRVTVTERKPEPVVSAPVEGPVVAAKSPGEKRVRWGIAVVAAMLAILCAFGLRRWERRRVVETPKEHGSIVMAVMPFTNRTGDAANDSLVEGLTENLIRQFSGISPLKVMSRGAVGRLDGREGAQALGVSAMMNGVLKKNADGHVVLDTELSSVNDGSVVESREYLPEQVGQRLDLMPVQADIFKNVIRGLKIEPDARETENAKRPPTTDPEAFQDFLQGEAAAQEQSPEGLHKSIASYEAATRLDPNFGLAWVGQAESHTFLGLYYEPPGDHMSRARAYAQRALTIDSSLWDAHGVLGLIDLVYDWDYAAASAELASLNARQSAISQLSCMSHLMERTGHARNAEETVNHMLEYDPKSAALLSELGCIDYYRGDYNDASSYYRRAMAQDTHAPVVYWGMGKSLVQAGKYREALEVLRQFKTVNGFEPPLITSEIGYAEGLSGDRAAAMASIAELTRKDRKDYVDPFLVSLVYLGMKQKDDVYAWLDRAYAARSTFLIGIESDPKWKGMRGEARFQALLARMEAHSRVKAADSI